MDIEHTDMPIKKMEYKQIQYTKRTRLVGWLVRFYGISTLVGYLKPNPLLYK